MALFSCRLTLSECRARGLNLPSILLESGPLKFLSSIKSLLLALGSPLLNPFGRDRSSSLEGSVSHGEINAFREARGGSMLLGIRVEPLPGNL